MIFGLAYSFMINNFELFLAQIYLDNPDGILGVNFSILVYITNLENRVIIINHSDVVREFWFAVTPSDGGGDFIAPKHARLCILIVFIF
jgi:hypothetical protein